MKDSSYSTTFLAHMGKDPSSVQIVCCLITRRRNVHCLSSLIPSLVVGRSGKGRRCQEEMPGGPLEPRRRRRRGACCAWNDGNCSRPYCCYDHVCLKCYGDHRWSSYRSDRQDRVARRELTRDRKGGAP